MKTKILLLFLFLAIFSLFISNIVLADETEEEYTYSFIEDYETYNLYAEVIEAGDKEKFHDGYAEYIVQKVKIRILDKRFLNQEFDIIYYLEDGMNTRLELYDLFKKGDKVYAYAIYENNKLDVTAISYYDKTLWIALIFAIFASYFF